MFDLSLSEIAVVGVVALICIKPEDLPGLMYKAGRATAKIKAQANSFMQGFDVDTLPKAKTRWIEGDDGKMYEAYDVANKEGENR